MPWEVNLEWSKLLEWAMDELKAGNRIKANRITKVSDRLKQRWIYADD